MFSIAAAQILLALALVALLLSGEKLRLPPIWLPLACFLAWTLVSLAASPDPAGGLPQVRKMYVFSMLLVVYSLLREMGHVRMLFLAWAGAGALVAARGLVQFAAKYAAAREKGQNFYESYVGDRITGFMSHWMTFGGLEMFALLGLAAFLLFGQKERRRATWFWGLCFTLMMAALVLGFTRGIWIAMAAGMARLLWARKPWLVALLPAAALIGFLAAPDSVRHRVTSSVDPGRSDSNSHRIVTWRTGIEMIRAHPVFGLGPEQIKGEFDKYVPADIARPLPTGWYGHLHNIYLHYAAERGIPAALALIWLLVKILVDFARAIRALPPGAGDRRFILQAALAVVVAAMVAGISELNLGDSEVLMMFLAVVACGYVAAETPQVEQG